MKKLKKLFDEFKEMPLFNQFIISMVVIIGIVGFLSNYRTMKKNIKIFLHNFNKNDDISEFVNDIEDVFKKIVKAIKKVLNKENDNENKK